jgi:hypothetical protein
MNEAPIVNSYTEESRTVRLKALRPSRLKDPLLETQITISPVPIYV